MPTMRAVVNRLIALGHRCIILFSPGPSGAMSITLDQGPKSLKEIVDQMAKLAG